MYSKYFLVLIAMHLVFSTPSFGQSDSLSSCEKCVCDVDATPAGVMLSHIHPKGELMFSYRYSRLGFSDNYVGTEKVDNEYVYKNYLMSPQSMLMSMHMLMAMYGLSNRMTLMGMFHYHSMGMDMEMMPGTSHVHNGVTMDSNEDHVMRSNGIGDTRLQLLVGVVTKPKHKLMLVAGVSVPTGSIQFTGDSESMYENKRLPYGMQLGSGTWDLLPAINYAYQSGRFLWNTQLSSTIRTGYNSIGYKHGNEVSLMSWVSVNWLTRFTSSIRIEGTKSGYILGEDPTVYWQYEPAANPYAYGGERVSGYIGTNFHFMNGILQNSKLGVEYGIPVYQNLFGPQLGLRNVLQASYSIML